MRSHNSRLKLSTDGLLADYRLMRYTILVKSQNQLIKSCPKMEEKIQQNSISEKPKKRYWRFVAGFLLIIIIAVGGFFVWNRYFSPSAKLARQTQENYQKYLDFQKNYENAMKNDTYGGKTPEETLKMFIDALKKGDIELASKYFMLREDGTPDPKWGDGLIKTKEAGKLQEVISLLSKTKPAGSIMEGYFGFEIRDAKNKLVSDINIRLNKYSNVWKIESM